MNESPEELKAENLQEQLESVWKDRLAWTEGIEQKIEGLPEGTRFIELDTHTAVLRMLTPDAPINKTTGKPDDIPVAMFSTHGNTPEEIINTALKIGSAIIRGEVETSEAHEPEPNQKAA